MTDHAHVQAPDPAIFALMPLAGRHPEWFPKFRAVYIEDERHPEFDGMLQIETKAGGDNKSDFRKHIEIVQAHPNYRDMIENEENGTITFVLEIPEAFKDDVVKLKDGEIAKTSLPYQESCKRTFRDHPQLLMMFEAWFTPEQPQ